jgi:hypothetical protein
MINPGNKHILLPLLFLLGSLAVLHPQVDTKELETGQDPVSFINYEGPHGRIETRAQIRNIGFSLGQAIRGGAARSGPGNRYFVIHSVSDPEGNKLDADILGLGINVGVDHIRNLRLIIQGYLEGAYEYNVRDAALLAEYITIYNAVFRGNWDFFTSRYKTPVIGYLTPEKAGLPVRFDEWPGQTLILIPLQTAQAGSLSAIDTTTLTEGGVIDELRQDDDLGVPQRKGMVELKERESEEAEQKAAEKREAIVNEEQRIDQERQQNQEERQQIEEERQQIRKDQEEGLISPEEARAAEQAMADREAEADQKDRELDQQEEALEEQREEAEKTGEFAETKTAEAQQEREDIAKDQQSIINQDEPPMPEGFIGIKLASPDAALGRLVRIEAGYPEPLQVSVLDTIHARTFTTLDGKLLAVAGENRGSAAIRLIEIDPLTLEMAKQGDDDIHPQSLLWINGSDIYAITVSGGKLYLGLYNTDLVRLARSSITIHPFASITIKDDTIVTQNADGQAVLLNTQDLTERK